jgi:hypothetical protein
MQSIQSTRYGVPIDPRTRRKQQIGSSHRRPVGTMHRIVRRVDSRRARLIPAHPGRDEVGLEPLQLRYLAQSDPDVVLQRLVHVHRRRLDQRNVPAPPSLQEGPGGQTTVARANHDDVIVQSAHADHNGSIPPARRKRMTHHPPKRLWSRRSV